MDFLNLKKKWYYLRKLTLPILVKENIENQNIPINMTEIESNLKSCLKLLQCRLTGDIFKIFGGQTMNKIYRLSLNIGGKIVV